MINISKYDIVVVKFPFASSSKYKARPAVVLSSELYNQNARNTLLIMAISSKIDTALGFEYPITNYKESGLLKPSVFKASIATIDKDYILAKLGKLSELDIKKLKIIIEEIC
ncbi:MAG: type II toxin-antitoxin system PemK/MazF family toxin [Campylobacterota bacterium]|nr:type II toxin-antitoxin system PemK/MazF family toxin [Campylobacterota bacterium]